MKRRAVKLLEDVQKAALSIQTFTAGKTETEYLASEMLRAAVEREFQIVGEALRLLRDEDTALLNRISHHSRIIGFRHMLVHGYDLIEDEDVWQTVVSDLPVLLAEIHALLAEQQAHP